MRQRDKDRKCAGFGAFGALGLVAGIFVVWFIMMSILDFIGARHQAKTKKNMERFESYKPKKAPLVNRKTRGYSVKY